MALLLEAASTQGLAAGECNQVGFPGDRTGAAGSAPHSIVAVDLNADGRPDIITSGGSPRPDLTILLNEFTFDRTPPTLSCPEALSTRCTSAEGAAVQYGATAEDDCDPSVIVSYDPAPGSVFPVGTTLVTCTAEDSYGNRSQCTFQVEVTCGKQLPGDCNQDAQLDISDAICILGALYDLDSPGLPCGDKLPTDAGNLSVLDWQPDGAVDLADGIALLLFLFDHGHPHPLVVPGLDARSCLVMPDCPENLLCR